MDIQELIDTLNNVADKTVRVKVTSPHGIVGTTGVLLTSDGVQIITDEAIDAVPPADAPVPVTSMDYPSVLLETADVDFNWPDGVRVKDRDGDIYTRKAGKWAWTETSSGVKRAYDGINDGYMIKSYLPATVI